MMLTPEPAPNINHPSPFITVLSPIVILNRPLSQAQTDEENGLLHGGFSGMGFIAKVVYNIAGKGWPRLNHESKASLGYIVCSWAI